MIIYVFVAVLYLVIFVPYFHLFICTGTVSKDIIE